MHLNMNPWRGLDRYLTDVPEGQSAQEALEDECENVEILASTSDGDAQEVLSVAMEYGDDALMGKIVRDLLAGRSVQDDMKKLLDFGIQRVAEFNLARKS